MAKTASATYDLGLGEPAHVTTTAPEAIRVHDGTSVVATPLRFRSGGFQATYWLEAGHRVLRVDNDCIDPSNSCTLADRNWEFRGTLALFGFGWLQAMPAEQPFLANALDTTTVLAARIVADGDLITLSISENNYIGGESTIWGEYTYDNTGWPLKMKVPGADGSLFELRRVSLQQGAELPLPEAVHFHQGALNPQGPEVVPGAANPLEPGHQSLDAFLNALRNDPTASSGISTGCISGAAINPVTNMSAAGLEVTRAESATFHIGGRQGSDQFRVDYTSQAGLPGSFEVQHVGDGPQVDCSRAHRAVVAWTDAYRTLLPHLPDNATSRVFFYELTDLRNWNGAITPSSYNVLYLDEEANLSLVSYPFVVRISSVDGQLEYARQRPVDLAQTVATFGT